MHVTSAYHQVAQPAVNDECPGAGQRRRLVLLQCAAELILVCPRRLGGLPAGLQLLLRQADQQLRVARLGSAAESHLSLHVRRRTWSLSATHRSRSALRLALQSALRWAFFTSYSACLRSFFCAFLDRPAVGACSAVAACTSSLGPPSLSLSAAAGSSATTASISAPRDRKLTALGTRC